MRNRVRGPQEGTMTINHVDTVPTGTIAAGVVTVATPTCAWCGRDGRLAVDLEGLRLYRNGALAQVAFPAMSSDDREQIITGTHPACWAEMFGELEDGGR